jgi:amino acid permease
MRNIEMRALTVVLILVGVACIGLAVVYFVTTARDLPNFIPGHTTGSTTHHVKHGLAMLGLAAIAFIGAWFTTAPRSTSDTEHSS